MRGTAARRRTAVAALIITALWTGPLLSAGNTPLLQGVRVEGNRAFPERAILDMLQLKPGTPWDRTRLEQNVRATLLERYRQEGYLFAKVEQLVAEPLRGGAAVDVTLRLSEGLRTRIGAVTVRGNLAISEGVITEVLRLRPGAIFREAAIEADIEAVLTLYEESGFPFARVAVDDTLYAALVQTPERVALILVITEGPPVMVDRVLVEGNVFTRPHVIVRESGLVAGQRYSREALTDAERRIARLGFVEPAGAPALVGLPEGGYGVALRVAERPPNQMNGVIGYVPGTAGPAGKTAGSPTGQIDLAFGNLLGTGRALTARWHGRDRTSQDLLVSYQEPWVLNTPLHATVGFGQSVQDSTFLRRELTAAFRYPVGRAVSVDGGFGRRTSQPEAYGWSYHLLQPERTYFLRGGVVMDGWDDPLNPRRGMYAAMHVSVGRRSTLPAAESAGGPSGGPPAGPAVGGTTDREYQGEWALAVPLWRRTAAYVKAAAWHIRTGSGLIPYSQLLPLGGARTLRGYREQQFRGSTVAWYNLEYRYLMGRRSRLFVFHDAGYIGHAGRRLFKPAFGWGLRMDSRMGIIGFDYALGEGDHPANGKVHFGLETAF